MLTLSVMSIASLGSFGGTPALRENKILCSLSEGLLVGPRFSAAIVLSNTFSLFQVAATVTRMVFPFQKTVVYCCTGRVLAPDFATVALLGRATECENYLPEEGAWAGHGT